MKAANPLVMLTAMAYVVPVASVGHVEHKNTNKTVVFVDNTKSLFGTKNHDSPPDILTIVVTTDFWYSETLWNLWTFPGQLVSSYDGYQNSLTEYRTDLDIYPGSYTFTVYDTWGDGNCCLEGKGGVALLLNNQLFHTVPSFPEFSHEYTFKFDLPSSSPSPPTPPAPPPPPPSPPLPPYPPLLENCVPADKTPTNWPAPRLVEVDPPRSYTWLVSFQNDNGEHQCSGILISTDTVLAPALCFFPTSIYSSYFATRAVIGMHSPQDQACVQTHEIEEVISYPGLTYAAHNIALVKLKGSPVAYYEPIHSLMSPSDSQMLEPGQEVTVAGFVFSDYEVGAASHVSTSLGEFCDSGPTPTPKGQGTPFTTLTEELTESPSPTPCCYNPNNYNYDTSMMTCLGGMDQLCEITTGSAIFSKDGEGNHVLVGMNLECGDSLNVAYYNDWICEKAAVNCPSSPSTCPPGCRPIGESIEALRKRRGLLFAHFVEDCPVGCVAASA